MRTVYLKQGIDPSKENGKLYTVTKTIDVVKFVIGDRLSASYVADLCNDASYKIIIS